ncbi:MAG: class I SAM-dependent methyltransferase [Magnetospirillum sp.]|nr:class I SAM-dependent methyltransferase [Magnetospirillum sp.]
MPIVKARTHVEVYRLRASSLDIHELNGRGADKATTALVTDEIATQMGLLAPGNWDFLDVGCGDGSLAAAAAASNKSVVGTAPSAEEIESLERHHADRPIVFKRAMADALPFADASFDRVVIHGVVTILPNEDAVLAAIGEVARVTRPGGLVWIGSVPDRDENAFYGRTYGDSIAGWLRFVLRREGPHAALRAALRVARAAVSSEPFVIQPKEVFVCPPDRFAALAASRGLRVLRHFRLRVARNGAQPIESLTRVNFVLER